MNLLVCRATSASALVSNVEDRYCQARGSRDSTLRTLPRECPSARVLNKGAVSVSSVRTGSEGVLRPQTPRPRCYALGRVLDLVGGLERFRTDRI